MDGQSETILVNYCCKFVIYVNNQVQYYFFNYLHNSYVHYTSKLCKLQIVPIRVCKYVYISHRNEEYLKYFKKFTITPKKGKLEN